MKKLILMCLLVPEPLFADINQKATRAMLPLHTEQYTAASPSADAYEDELRRYVGVYQLDEQFRISITLEEGKLYGLAPGDAEKTEFTPVSKNKFIKKDRKQQLNFWKRMVQCSTCL